MSNERPAPELVPENRYDLLVDRQDVWDPSVAVVVPVYNQSDRLRRTLEGLRRQTRAAEEVVVADDGSEEAIEAVVAEFDDLPISYTRQERDGFGAGRARNLGASSSESDVLLFVDADCIPRSDLIERHHAWHAKASGLVVVGDRLHALDTDVAEAISDTSLQAVAVPDPGDRVAVDWRSAFYSLNRRMRTGDDGFRSFVTSNASVDRVSFDAVGGFTDVFTAWGGEDTELGWRLWNAGTTFVAEDEAVVFHQYDEAERRDGRDRARSLQAIAFADRIPHPPYRSGQASFYSIPMCSWVVRSANEDETLASWRALDRSSAVDAELIVVGPEGAVGPAVAAQSDRIRGLIDSPIEEAVLVASGQFVVLVDGRVRVGAEFLRRAIGLMAGNPRLGIVTGALAQDGARIVRSRSDIDATSEALSRDGLPLLAVVRRRELTKEIAHDGRIDWGRLVARNEEGLAFEASDVAGVEPVVDAPSRIGPADARSAGMRQLGDAVSRMMSRLSKRRP